MHIVSTEYLNYCRCSLHRLCTPKLSVIVLHFNMKMVLVSGVSLGFSTLKQTKGNCFYLAVLPFCHIHDFLFECFLLY